MRRAAGTLGFDRPLSAMHRIANDSGGLAVSPHVHGVGKDHVSNGVNGILNP